MSAVLIRSLRRAFASLRETPAVPHFRPIVFCICPYLMGALPAAETPKLEPTLAGSWAGRWTDSRKEYGGSGGSFTCEAVGAKENVWKAKFNVGGARTFDVELKGKISNGVIVFDSVVDLGSFHGKYKWKGRVTEKEFTGEYDGPDEKGTFKMERAPKLQESKGTR